MSSGSCSTPTPFFVIYFPHLWGSASVKHIETEMLCMCIQKCLWFSFGTRLLLPGSGIIVHKRWYCVRDMRVLLHKADGPPYPKGRVQLLTSTLLCTIHSWLSPSAVSVSCQTPYQFTKPTLQAGLWETGPTVGRGGGGNKKPPFRHFTVLASH